jgi:hypothetical protein
MLNGLHALELSAACSRMFNVCGNILGNVRGDVLGACRGDVPRALGGDMLRCVRVGCRSALRVASVRSTHKCQATNQNKESSHVFATPFASIDLHPLEWASRFLRFVVHILPYLIYAMIFNVLRKSTKKQ